MCIFFVLTFPIETGIRIFVETFDEKHEKQEDHNVHEAMTFALAETESFPRTATVGADSFVSRAVADPAVVRFLGMRPSTAGGAASGTGSGSGSSSNSVSSTSQLTLREALRELVCGASGSGEKSAKPESRKSRLRWEDIEAVLFRPYDPTEIFSNPPSTIPIGFPQVDPRGTQQQQEEVCAQLGLVGFVWKRNKLVLCSSLAKCVLARCLVDPTEGLFYSVSSSHTKGFHYQNTHSCIFDLLPLNLFASVQLTV